MDVLPCSLKRNSSAIVGKPRLANMFCVALLAELQYLIDSKSFLHNQCLFRLSMCLHEFVRFVIKESTRFDNNDCEPKAQVRLFKVPKQNKKLSKKRIVKNILSFFQMSECERMLFAKRELHTTKWKNTLQDYLRRPRPELTIFRSKSHALHSM